jgi:hypothetical protein
VANIKRGDAENAELRRDDEANPKLPKLLRANFLAKRLDCGDSSPLFFQSVANIRFKAALKLPQSRRFANFGRHKSTLRPSAFSVSLR